MHFFTCPFPQTKLYMQDNIKFVQDSWSWSKFFCWTKISKINICFLAKCCLWKQFASLNVSQSWNWQFRIKYFWRSWWYQWRERAISVQYLWQRIYSKLPIEQTQFIGAWILLQKVWQKIYQTSATEKTSYFRSL